MTEARTRRELIDKRLFTAGWDVQDHTKVIHTSRKQAKNYTSGQIANS